MIVSPYVLVIAAQLAQRVAAPQLNVAPSCRASSSLDPVNGQNFTICMRDETEAHDQLAKNWAGYSAMARSRCSAEVRIGGDPSYVELLECLEMDKTASQIESRGAN